MSRNDWTDEKLFYRLINNKSTSTYWNNIRALRQRPNKDVFNKCVELTASEDQKSREIGIDILAQLGSEPRPFYSKSNEIFFKLLNKEKDPQVLMKLLYAIGHNNRKLSKIQISELCELSTSDDALIRGGLVSSLLFINDAKASDTLIKLSSDKVDHIRDWATFSLGQTDRDNKKIRDALWNSANDKHNDTRSEAIAGLARRKDDRTKELITRELSSGVYDTLILEAIIEYGDKSCLPTLRSHLKVESLVEDINPEWLAKLKECIAELKKK